METIIRNTRIAPKKEKHIYGMILPLKRGQWSLIFQSILTRR